MEFKSDRLLDDLNKYNMNLMTENKNDSIELPAKVLK